jgi:hypothetical protein
VMKSARKVASAAATIMLMAIHGSGLRDGVRLAPRTFVCVRRDVSTTILLRDDLESGTSLFPTPRL